MTHTRFKGVAVIFFRLGQGDSRIEGNRDVYFFLGFVSVFFSIGEASRGKAFPAPTSLVHRSSLPYGALPWKQLWGMPCPYTHKMKQVAAVLEWCVKTHFAVSGGEFIRRLGGRLSSDTNPKRKNMTCTPPQVMLPPRKQEKKRTAMCCALFFPARPRVKSAALSGRTQSLP